MDGAKGAAGGKDKPQEGTCRRCRARKVLEDDEPVQAAGRDERPEAAGRGGRGEAKGRQERVWQKADRKGKDERVTDNDESLQQ